MINVIWGTGLYASEFAHKMKDKDISFFIDNDKEKCGKSFMGKKVLYPDSVENWENLYIYIPYNFYNEIKKQLQTYGVNVEKQCQKYHQINMLTLMEFKEDYQNCINMLYHKAKEMQKFCIFWGRSWAYKDKGYRDYIKAWCNNDQDLNLGLVSEAIWYTQNETEKIMALPAVITPAIFDDYTYVEDGILDKNQSCFLERKRYAQEGIECIKTKFSNLTDASAKYMIYHMYNYIEQTLDILHPPLIIVYPLSMVQHFILEEVCEEKGIPLISTHQGILPGTLEFDIGGEIGKSLLARYPQNFLSLSINDEDICHATRIWDYLYRSKLNRKIQHKNNCIEYIMEKIDKNKPIVFFAGQNDLNSRMVPYTEETKKYYSPIFHTSIDAGIYIAELCKKNNWNYIYKPHPMSTKYDGRDRLPNNTIYVEFGDINDLIDIADVVVTILSQTNYISLIRYKPVVMLGFNQIKGKGCTYEAFKKNEIENTIKIALKRGFTKQQKKAFLVHIAQVVKYYLYDDLQNREIRFGQKPPKYISQFYKLEKLLKK